MIEAQQRMIDRANAPRIMPTAHDRGVTIYTRLGERLVRQEEQARKALGRSHPTDLAKRRPAPIEAAE